MSRLSQILYDRLVEQEKFIRDQTRGDPACESAISYLMEGAHTEATNRGDGQILFSLPIEPVDVVWNLKHVLVPMFAATYPHHSRLWLYSLL